MPVTGAQGVQGVMASRGATNSIHNLMPPADRLKVEGRASLAGISAVAQVRTTAAAKAVEKGKGSLIDVSA